MAAQDQKSMEDVIRDDGRYPLEAFAFLHDGLTRAANEIHGNTESQEEVEEGRHVTGQQLSLALRDLAVERYGLLARTVLGKWNIHATIDFGNMVYLLVDNGLMRKTEEDSIEDFRDIYSFDTAFQVDLKIELK